MRFAFGFFLVICLAAVVLASPAKNKQAPACSKNCGDDYNPICAKAKNGSKERLITFGNECVMDNYNCQHSDDPYGLKSKGECGGGVGVRLS